MEGRRVKIRLQKIREGALFPKQATEGSVGYDIFACVLLDKNTRELKSKLPVEISPGETVLIGTGFKMEIPFPWQAEIRPRSGLAGKQGIEIPNSPGTIDPDFRGEVGVLIKNCGKEKFILEKNIRIAQMVFAKAEIPEFEQVPNLSKSPRGENGFGSTGA